MPFGVQSEWEEPVDLPASGCGVHGVRVMSGEGWERRWRTAEVEVERWKASPAPVTAVFSNIFWVRLFSTPATGQLSAFLPGSIHPQ